MLNTAATLCQWWKMPPYPEKPNQMLKCKCVWRKLTESQIALNCATVLLSNCHCSGTVSIHLLLFNHVNVCVGPCPYVSSGLNFLDVPWSSRQLPINSLVPLHGTWICGHEQHLSHWLVCAIFWLCVLSVSVCMSTLLWHVCSSSCMTE